MPVAVVKRNKLMLAHGWLTDSAFIKESCTGHEIEIIEMMGPNTATPRIVPVPPNAAVTGSFPGPPDPRTDDVAV
jgi:hypothetical protein